MLRRLFKSRHRLSHSDAAERRAAVLALDPEEAQALTAELTRLLHEDPDVQVRQACIQRITDPAVLEPLCADGRLGAAASRRLQALQPDAARAAAGHDDLLTLAPDEAAARLQQIDDVESLIDLALKARGPVRELLLEHPRLQPAGALTALEKRTRDHDKTLNRHARRRLERRKSLQQEAGACRTRAQELAAALARRDTTTRDRAWRERQHELFRRLEQTLETHAGLRAQLAEFGDSEPALEDLRMDATALPELEPDTAAADSVPASAEDPFVPLVQAFRALDAALIAGEPFDGLAARRQALTEQWLIAADHRPPSATQHAVFEAASHRFRELADAMDRLRALDLPPLPETLSFPDNRDAPVSAEVWQSVERRHGLAARLERAGRSIAWPEWAPPAPELGTIRQAAATLTDELAVAESRLAEEVTTLAEQLDALRQAIDDGHLQEAQSLLGRVRARHDALPGSAVRRLGSLLGKEAARLAELKDWQTFATTPKRESLVDAMAGLAEHPQSARDQAERIKHLRREWQALGPVTRATDARLADRFNALAETAFEPCRAYFAELAQQRQANLAERNRICDQLEHYLEDTDWSRADMKAAERIMRAARDEWRTYHPVDRNPGKTVEGRFEKLQQRLHDRVKAEWDHNLAAKQVLVEEARELAATELPVRDKVEGAKVLQRRWRDVGITPRRPDQQLWRAFRSACDQIFEAREEARHAQDVAITSLEARLTEALDAMESQLAGMTPRDASEGDLRTFVNQTAEVDRLPQARRRSLAERRRTVAERYRKLLEQRRVEAARELLAAIERWDSDMAEAECTGGSAPEPPPGLATEIVTARSACAGEPIPADDLRRLAVRAELAAGHDSPGQDQGLRMELQVERLQAGLGGARTPESPESLVADWCRLGPKNPSVAPLRSRFFAALADRH